jgi:geranylgeranyl transferase type-2 subunit beta
MLYIQKHIDYIKSLETQNKSSLMAVYSAHLRLNAIYWGTTALYLMNAIDQVDRKTIIQSVMECYHPKVGGFGGHEGHDAHLLFTLSAIQVLATFDALNEIDPNMILNCKIAFVLMN